MNTCILLYFEHKNDVTIIIKLCKAIHAQLVVQNKFTMTVKSFFVQNAIGQLLCHNFLKCQIHFLRKGKKIASTNYCIYDIYFQ